MVRPLLCCLALFGATHAFAQPPPQPSGTNLVTMEPTEIDTIGCRFNSWTMTGAGTATVTLIGPPARPDASPSAIIVGAPTLAANVIAVQLNPDFGCGTSGCRNGNSYQIKLRGVAGTDYPTCNFRVNVRKVVFQ